MTYSACDFIGGAAMMTLTREQAREAIADAYEDSATVRTVVDNLSDDKLKVLYWEIFGEKLSFWREGGA